MPRTVPSLASHTVGDVISSASWNAGPVAANAFSLAPPIFMGYLNGTQSIATGSYVAIGLNASNVDSDSGHSNVTNNSRYTAQVAGWYLVNGVVAFAANTTGTRVAAIYKNGAVLPYPTGGTGDPDSSLACAAITPLCLIQLNVGDYVELRGFQSSGGSLSTASTTRTSCGMSLWWVAHV